MIPPATPRFLRLTGIRKSFGSVHALDGVDFTVQGHELIGLVGHNGAGKSTLMHVLAGTITADEGTILIDDAPAAYGLAQAQAAGVRCVFQELSLCPNLSVLENTRLAHRRLVGMGWRRRAAGLIREQLDAIFPNHGIDTNTIVHDLAIGERQMVEIARAFTIIEAPPRLVILDEPTSSLDAHRSSQLLAYLERSVETGLSCIMISHMLGEILGHADRIVVMRDGTVVADGPAGEFDRERLVVAMGGHEREPVESARSLAVRDAPEVVHARFTGACTDLVAHAGEIIGLAGLAGHGQTTALLAVFDANGKDVQVQGEVALVAGDRQRDGVFPRASISANMTVSSLAELRQGLFVSAAREVELTTTWQRRIAIRTPDLRHSILTLSGGNQQKVLFARALAAKARIILMDDPMRGVDIATKLEVYALIRAEAARGRTFLWYTTETEELDHCDRVYVFRNGTIVAKLDGSEVTEARVIAASFAETASA